MDDFAIGSALLRRAGDRRSGLLGRVLSQMASVRVDCCTDSTKACTKNSATTAAHCAATVHCVGIVHARSQRTVLPMFSCCNFIGFLLLSIENHRKLFAWTHLFPRLSNFVSV